MHHEEVSGAAEAAAATAVALEAAEVAAAIAVALEAAEVAAAIAAASEAAEAVVATEAASGAEARQEEVCMAKKPFAKSNFKLV